jgi:hypothetical protein
VPGPRRQALEKLYEEAGNTNVMDVTAKPHALAASSWPVKAGGEGVAGLVKIEIDVPFQSLAASPRPTIAGCAQSG